MRANKEHHSPMIILTRPEGQNERLKEKINHIGLECIVMPWLSIRVTWTPSEREEWWKTQAIQYTAIVFVSTSAAIAALPKRIHWPEQVWAVAPGSGTAGLLQEKGISKQWVCSPKAQFDSEGIWEECRECFSPGNKVAIFRGQEGRSWLGDQIACAQGLVDYYSVYYREVLLEAIEQLKALLKNHIHRPIYIIATHSEALKKIGSQLPYEYLKTISVFVPHHRIKKTAQEIGITNIVLTDGGEEGLWQGIKNFFSVCC